MFINEDIGLLIKSKYPVVFLETVDEEYAIRQLKTIAGQMGFIFYQWSLTSGLRRGCGESPYYHTKEPSEMLKMAFELTKPSVSEPSLFALKDFNKYLDNAVVLRLFKDLINSIKNTKNTVIIISPDYSLPKDIELDAAHIVGGYPNRKEIIAIIKETVDELKASGKQIATSLSLDELNKILDVLKGLSTQQIRNILNKCIIEDNALTIKDRGAIEKYKKEIFDKEGLLEFYIPENKENLANFDNLKRWLSERKNSFVKNETTALPSPKGVLLMGVQGCGKSLAIKVIARELNLPIYRLDIGKLYSKYIGETEQNLRKALMVVEKLCPVCLWIDEIEKGFAASGGDIDGGVSQRILGTFLTWVQERKASCFIAATANDIYRLPPEFLRKGRFDEIFFVDLPDAQSRERLLKIHLQKRELKPEEFDLKKIVDITGGFSGAEIEQAIISALYSSSTEKEVISTRHIVEQIKSTKPLSVLKQEEITTLRAWAKERTIPA